MHHIAELYANCCLGSWNYHESTGIQPYPTLPSRFAAEQSRDKLQRQLLALDAQVALHAGRVREEQASRQNTEHKLALEASRVAELQALLQSARA